MPMSDRYVPNIRSRKPCISDMFSMWSMMEKKHCWTTRAGREFGKCCLNFMHRCTKESFMHELCIETTGSKRCCNQRQKMHLASAQGRSTAVRRNYSSSSSHSSKTVHLASSSAARIMPPFSFNCEIPALTSLYGIAVRTIISSSVKPPGGPSAMQW